MSDLDTLWNISQFKQQARSDFEQTAAGHIAHNQTYPRSSIDSHSTSKATVTVSLSPLTSSPTSLPPPCPSKAVCQCFYCVIDGTIPQSKPEQLDVKTGNENPVNVSKEGQPFWRGFEDNSSQHVEIITDNTNTSALESTAPIVVGTGTSMALISNRRLCTLDAICAKLKSKGPSSGIETDRQETRDREDDEVPQDLSSKCLNNNIIGKVDLHHVNLAQNGTADDSHKSSNSLHTKSAETNNTAEDEAGNFSLIPESPGGKELSRNNSVTPSSRKTGIFHDIGSSRRKSRKASTPRNIAQVRDMYDNIDEKDELAEYEINNLNTNFPPEESEEPVPEIKETSTSNKTSFTNSPNTEYMDDDNSNHSSALNQSKSSSLNLSVNSKKSAISSDVSDVFDDTVPLDLSVSKANEFDNDGSVHCSENFSDNEDDFNDNKSLIIDEEADKRNISGPNSPIHNKQDFGGEQAAHLKDYAESTMNELISMYGFGGSNPSDFKSSNFKHILHSQLRPLSADLPGVPATKKPKLSVDSESDDGSQHGKAVMAPFSKSIVSGNQNKLEGSAKLQNDRFTSSSSFINAVFSANSGPGGDQLLTNKTLLPNYSKYLKRYNNGTECGGQHCNNLSYKEHYHCISCSFQVFLKKEEMVRHYKWHKKREESLQHGFLRFSPLDNCSKRFGPCTHNRKQTHYHCLQNGCDKVYISTSDVQMHANYHRKDSAIMSEGFQRFRATEDCGTLSCAFYGQRTTHFHCLRPDCKFTFKNKADMEKHKSYHQKDEVLGRDGFKKFMKYEHCNFQGCRYSKLSNHIHCIRSGCDYVLHSTAQLYSHKRKHERRDFEAAYKNFRTNQPQPQPSVAPPNKVIIPRNDFGTIAQSQSLPLKPGIQAVPTSVIQTMAGLKRPAHQEQIEPLELKKPKIEPREDSYSDMDTSVPPSPTGISTGRSSPYETTIDKSLKNESIDDAGSDFSDSGQYENGKHLENSSYDEDSIDLSGSLSLQIPLLPRSSNETGTNHLEDSKAAVNLKLSAGNPPLSAAFSSISSPMSGTLPGTLVSMMNQGTLMTVPSTLTGSTNVLQPPKSVYNERREKDDSWKNYLVRYTANDPCNPRCQYLYKDHYHCKMNGCLVLFKSKDGVREHARFHELQDRITPIAYKEYDETEACPEACQYSEKDKHYHCIWTGCTHVVPYIGPTFGRLEHYRIHEYARAAAGKAYNRSSRAGGSMEENHIRRRGRPPKYPKIELPKIPKVELTDEEIRQSHTPIKNVEGSMHRDQKVINGFRIFDATDPCPDEQCSYIGRLHYHCARPRCFTITDRVDVLNLHAKDFHSFVNILEGYEFFDRNVSCRRMNCPNNQTNRHFHCTRPKCDYSFIRHSTMSQHEKKHSVSENGKPHTGSDVYDKPLSPTLYRRDVPIRPAIQTSANQALPVSPGQSVTSLVKTESGAFVPVPSIKQNLLPNIPLLISPTQGPLIIPQSAAGLQQATLPGGTASTVTAVPLAIPISTIQALPPSVTSTHLVAGIPNSVITTANTDSPSQPDQSSSSAPLTVLLQRGINQIPQPSWNEIKAKMHYALSQNCGRPFCKLKKKDHYHCYDCNQAFSDPARLRSHIGKHGIKFKRSDSSTQPLALITTNTDEKKSAQNQADNTENGDIDPDEARCLADNGNASDSDAEEDKNSSSLNLNPSTFSEMISKAQEQNKLSDFPDASYGIDNETAVDYSKTGVSHERDLSESVNMCLDFSSRSGRKITKTKHEGFMNSGDINMSKQRQFTGTKSNMVLKQPYKLPEPNHKHLVTGPPTRGIKDDSVPDGYSRWKYNEECNYPKCPYRHSVTHFHCNRSDCGYGFSDRSRLVQHTLRHERIDSITGGELQQYRINQDCEQPNCEFNKKMSHFHCKRCNYNCTDSSKVLTHRKYHAKLDSIANQGFRKFSASEECGISMCTYSKKQTHFHCLVETCKAAVLGLPQMNSHKLKHVGNLH